MRARPLSRVLLVLAFGVLCGRPAVRADDPAPAGPDIDETRGYIGYRPGFVQDLEADARKSFGITRKAGLYVVGVTAKGPAAKAGIKAGDVVRKVKGTEVEGADQVLPNDEGEASKWLSGAFKAITSTIKPGEEVEMVLDRGGQLVTVKPIAITRDEMKALSDAEQEERDAVQVPDPEDNGAPIAYAYSFEKLADDIVRPENLLAVTGFWEVGEDDDGKDNHALKQSSDMADLGFALAVAHDKGLSAVDSVASVRLRFDAGEKSVSGGIAFRVRDRKTWYAVVADGVAKKLQVIVMKEMKPTVVAAADLGSPKLKAWHTLEVKTVGDTIEATFDGTVKVSAKDGSIKQTGWFGLVTRGDAETAFDDWRFGPAK